MESKKDRRGLVALGLISSLLFSDGLVADDFKVAVRAHHGIEAAVDLWQPTIDVLSKQIPGHTFSMLPIVSLDEIAQQAAKGTFDFVLTNPSSFVELKQQYGVIALVTLNNKRANTAQSRFGSVIFTHVRNSDILTIKDLKERTLMAVSEPAFGGWRVAWLEMLNQNFDPYKELKSLIFAESKTQPEVVQSVRDGKVDVGVVRTDLLERMEAAGEIDMRYLRVINNKDVKGFPFFLSTALYPEWPFAAMKSVPDELAKKVKQIMMSIEKNDPAAQSGQYVGWLPSEDYTSVEELMKRLKVGSDAN